MIRRSDNQHSRFWMGQDSGFEFDPRKEFDAWDAETLLKLAAYKRAVANFVHILTQKDIPVVYNTGQQSMTDGTTVVLSAKLEHDQFDTAVGTALHEASHCVFTEFQLGAVMRGLQQAVAFAAKNLLSDKKALRKELGRFMVIGDDEKERVDRVLNETDVTKLRRIYDRIVTLEGSDYSARETMFAQTKLVENWIEDRRIDYLQALISPGYRGYYNALYDAFFLNKVVGKAITSPNYRRTENWDSYMFRLINILHPDRDLDALKGLREIWDVLDIEHIDRLKSSLDTWTLAYTVVDIIYRYIGGSKKKEAEQKKSSPQSNGDNSQPRRAQERYNDDDSSEFSDEDESEDDGRGTKVASDDNDTGDDNYDQGFGGGESEKASDEDGGKNEDEDSKSEDGDGDDDAREEAERDADAKNDDELSSDADAKNDDELSSDAEMKRFDREVKRQSAHVEGDSPKTKLSRKVADAIRAVEEGGVSLEAVGSTLMDYNGHAPKVQCVVIREVTKALIDSQVFPNLFRKGYDYGNGEDYVLRAHQKAVMEGMRLGAMLGKKLQTRNESRDTRYSRLEEGRIDQQLLASLGYANSRVFYRDMVDKYEPMMLHISLDASGSMSGNKWCNALTSTVAIVKAATMVANLNVVVSVRSTAAGVNNAAVRRLRRSRWQGRAAARSTFGYGTTMRPLIAIVYDSRKDKLSKVTTLFKHIYPGGETPEGLAFEAILDEMVDAKNGQMESLFLNLSDGEPCFSVNVAESDGAGKETNSSLSYRGEIAAKHTAEMVNRMRRRGIKILSYFISIGDEVEHDSSYEIFKKCYGADARHINVKNIVDLAKTLNQKFLEKV